VTNSAGQTTFGQKIGVSDSSPHTYFDAANPSGGFLATDGVGSFTGVWSNPAPNANPSPGSGTVTVVYQGSSLVLGIDETLAICYYQDAFAPYPIQSLAAP
jgi:hypothetical protein